jgi:hypothetical protein
MENKATSEISWVLVGVRPRGDEPLQEEVLHKIMEESFQEDRTYSLFLCGTEVDKTGTLEEMEEGYRMIKKGVEDYTEGDYCIISKHDEGDLLFMPAVLDEGGEKEAPSYDA